MLYQPTVDAVASHDSRLYYLDGMHYLFILYRSSRHKGPGTDGMALATSTDGVHFDEVGPIIRKSDLTSGAVIGIATWKIVDMGVEGMHFGVSFSEALRSLGLRVLSNSPSPSGAE